MQLSDPKPEPGFARFLEQGDLSALLSGFCAPGDEQLRYSIGDSALS